MPNNDRNDEYPYDDEPNRAVSGPEQQREEVRELRDLAFDGADR